MSKLKDIFNSILIKIIFKSIGGTKMKCKGLATVYAYLIIDRELTYAEVPKFLKKSVKEMLITLGAEELAMEGTAATDA